MVDSGLGYLGMEQCGILPLFSGIAMHDCWVSAFIDLSIENEGSQR